MIIDNFKLIEPFLVFSNENEFYFLQIIQRKKDGFINKNYKLIKSYYIYSVKQFQELKMNIITLCKENNARAYINLNVRNSKELAFHAISNFTNLLRENNTNSGYRLYDSICGKYKASKKISLWIVDIDSKNTNLKNEIIDYINKCKSIYSPIIRQIIPTLNGYHLITFPFNLQEFKSKYSNIDIHKNNPTLLYFNI